ncbi:MAG: ABC transporter substrate-binding protein [Rhodocyclaceae bacterium]|nr:ABC transporter substrate-binding protein [Rhodocyclaceae bacterium]MBX3669068.1 ABC transporter substrate-binding protein [Rhodocyclaceae bacterium]
MHQQISRVTFFTRRAGPLLFGLLLATAVRADILVGQSTGLSGQIAAGSQENVAGAKLYFDNVNANGGINGEKIVLETLDDAYDPKRTAENARKLIEEKNVVAMFLTRGTPTTEAIIPLLDKYRVPLVGPSSGAMVLRQPFKPMLYHVRATYQHESERCVELLTAMGQTKFAVLYQESSFGRDALAGAERGFAKAKLKPVLSQAFTPDKLDFAPAVAELVKGGTESVLLFATETPAIAFVKELRKASRTVQVATISNNATSGFPVGLGDLGRGTVVSQVVPNPSSLSIPLVKEITAIAKAKGVAEVTPTMIEGFVAAKVLAEGMRRAGGKITRASLVDGLNSLKNYDVGGMSMNYSADRHDGADFVELSTISRDGRFQR